jgi:hypothetical protein
MIEKAGRFHQGNWPAFSHIGKSELIAREMLGSNRADHNQ